MTNEAQAKDKDAKSSALRSRVGGPKVRPGKVLKGSAVRSRSSGMPKIRKGVKVKRAGKIPLGFKRSRKR
jgi:hypothetical protein